VCTGHNVGLGEGTSNAYLPNHELFSFETVSDMETKVKHFSRQYTIYTIHTTCSQLCSRTLWAPNAILSPATHLRHEGCSWESYGASLIHVNTLLRRLLSSSSPITLTQLKPSRAVLAHARPRPYHRRSR
jgi:hypothetical protein